MTKLSSLSAFLIGLTLTFCVTLLGLIFGMYYQDSKYLNRIYPEVAIDGKIQQGKTPEEAKEYFNDLNKQLSALQLEVFYKDSPVATYSGEMLFLHSNGTSIVDRAYQVGRSGSTVSQFLQRFLILTRIQRYSYTSNIDYSIDPILETIVILEKQYNIEAKNALFAIKDGKVSAFAQEKDGLMVDSAEASQQVRAMLSFDSIQKLAKQPKPIRVTVNSSVLKPKISLSDANTLGIQEIIGIGTSDYSGSIPERVHNLLLATNRLNGTLIPQGELFSYNNSVGEITGATGYKPAYVILNGRTVLGDGGGVCQTSTTMFRAAINSGLPIVAWAPHAYRVHYYENDGTPGRDATVYAPSQDFSFRNDTSAAILIQTESDTENNLLKYTFWGKKDDRKIYISDVKMGNSIPAPESREQEDPTLPRGQRKQVDWAANGLNAWFDYKVTRGDEVIQEKRFVSNYRPWQAIYLVGTKD